jgi:hypothetical protein
VLISSGGEDFSSRNKADLMSSWTVAANSGFHVAAADSAGFGLLIQNGGMFVVQSIEVNKGQARFISFDSSPARNRRLNAYYPFDTNSLLSASN